MKVKNVQEGFIETGLGTLVTGIGTALCIKKIAPKVASGLIGFGIAHIALGSIDLIQDGIKGYNFNATKYSNNNNRLNKIHKNIRYDIQHNKYLRRHVRPVAF
ncbi:hypothetical protein CLTEP_07530 [Clostridium tepidiprofundi DSM 19306]|uniref:Asparagine synthase n=1 Tax=Clostridium tepidiprofundi DSM 19306 TaxID=1121338 RepID=A0A151B627_9CLOT|nr:hypothetical protein CLTEP_07530 [Clostridium tepidiprofundi DSM 19306]